MNKQDLNSFLQLALTNKTKEHTNLFYEAMYEVFFEVIYTIVRNRFPYQADDVTHDFYCHVILKIKLEKYAAVSDYLQQYIIRVLINFCSDVHHRMEREAVVLDTYSDKQHLKAASPHHRPIEQATDRMWLEFMLNKLNRRQQTAFLLHNYFGFKYRELPDLMDEEISAGAAKQLVVRAKKNLQQYL